ncbi:MAG: NAD+ synthase [Phycisphaerae bacterium]
MRIALAQINPVVGDVVGNTEKIIARIEESIRANADLVLLPELAVTGYPPKDLLLKKAFVRSNQQALERIAGRAQGVIVVVGYVHSNETDGSKGLSNMAAVCADGRVMARYAKMLLPTYDIFDELRYFDPGSQACVVAVRINGVEVKVGVTICEDIWSDDVYFARHLYGRDPVAELSGADMIVNIGASPFSVGKPARRNELFAAKAKQARMPLLSVNQVGGNDDLIFDGGGGAYDAEGRLIARARSFAEDFLVVDLDSADNRIEPELDPVSSIYQALVLGTRDYVYKCGFDGVVVGVSGGIDSAVTAAVAVAAIGAECVHLVALPSRFSSTHSREDAQALAETLEAEYRTISIEEIHSACERVLAPHFDGRPPDITEENMQARARGAILMALSNKFGWLLLTTGNKSELAVGYCTLYGHMCGGLAVLSDVPKTMVYQLAKYINKRAGRDLIPQRTITKPPSAELKENQTDQDTLPPYDVLDAILERYVEKEQSADEIVAEGFDESTVREVAGKVDRNEYKRKQIPVGLKVTSRAFGTGRRMPIAARYT